MEPEALQGERYLRRPVLFPESYTWFVFASALDLLMTWVVLAVGGREVNLLANWIMVDYGMRAIVPIKFGLVAFVIVVAEFVGRRRYDLGRKLAQWSPVLPLFAVTVAFIQLCRVLWWPE